ncbi:MAG: aminotransferase class III-fold pyridoxal phosphate-dependent enzyme, partial [Planctomycetaceae bacterium]|nr:aminotransferase class III-fold pyridoxal phosphate-dependent enzyme [Planctomycetaceae bacterium]
MSQVQDSYAVEFPGETQSNAVRQTITRSEPHSLRTYTPSQAVLAKSAGVFHRTPEGRRLYDYTSGVLVANLGHNPVRWMKRFFGYMGWTFDMLNGPEDGFFEAVSLTAYNAITELEAEASRRLLASLRSFPGGGRLGSVMWSASGSEAVQKALWACMRRDPKRPGIMATRHGFHGKKGLSGAVTGSETDRERDPRVRFVSFPREECSDIESPGKTFDSAVYAAELESVLKDAEYPIGCFITEPYLGGGGSYH